MAILKIARMGDPVLARKADPVPDPTAPEIGQLITDMIDTMKAAGGTGLAAPQIHVPLRVVIFQVAAERLLEAGEDAVPLTILINPEIENIGHEQEEGWEACLSVPGLKGVVPRETHIRYWGLTPEGKDIEREAKNFHARVVQHECDHLDGVLYPMRMRDLSTLMYVDAGGPPPVPHPSLQADSLPEIEKEG